MLKYLSSRKEKSKKKRWVGVGADRLTSDNKRSTLLVKHRVAIGVKQNAVAGDDAAWNVMSSRLVTHCQ